MLDANLSIPYIAAWVAIVAAILLLFRVNLYLGRRLGLPAPKSWPFLYLVAVLLLSFFHNASAMLLSLALTAPFCLTVPALLWDVARVYWAPAVFICAELNVLVFFV